MYGVLLLVLLLVLLPLVLAGGDFEESCEGPDDSYCQEICNELGETCECDLDDDDQYWCWYVEVAGGNTPAPNTTNTTTTQNVSSSRNVSNTTASINSSAIAKLEQRLAELEVLQDDALSSSAKITIIEQSLQQINPKIAQLTTDIQSLKSQLAQVTTDVQVEKTQRNTLATGQAGLQKNVQTVEKNLDGIKKDLEKEQSFTTFVKVIFFLLLFIAVGLGVAYFLLNKKNSSPVNGQIVSYITKHIKQGRKFPEIKVILMKAGWSEEDITRAYKDTMQQNYQNYLQGSSPSPASGRKPHLHTHKNKIVGITLVSVLVLSGLLFMLKGVSTGHAIFFQSVEDLDKGVKENLEKMIDKNPLYDALESGSVCVQVEDGDKKISYKLIKSARGKSIIRPSKGHCDITERYDASLKFTSWKAFDFLANSLSCENIGRIHQQQGMYILPSQYILPGFELNEDSDYETHCSLLRQCLSDDELTKAGLDCPE